MLACTRRDTELIGRFADSGGEGNRGDFTIQPCCGPNQWAGEFFYTNRGPNGASPQSWGAVYAGGGIATPLKTGSSLSRIGLGVVPFLNAGDDVEQAMHALVGAYKEVERIYNPPTANALLDVVRKQVKLKRRVNYLVIAGHGSKANPRIDLSKEDLGPEDVDLPGLRRERATLLAHARALTPASRKRLKQVKERIAYLLSVSDAMAKGAEVLLVNCSTAATPEGSRFVSNLGEVLLGKRGGTIIASRSDVAVGQVYSYARKITALYQTGGNVGFGEFFIGGDWKRFKISPRHG